MHTIDMLEEALHLASVSGWQIRHEWLGGTSGGRCRLGRIHILFVDRSLTAQEQLDQVLQGLRDQLELAVRDDPFTVQFIECLGGVDLSPELRRCLALSA